MMQVLGSEGQTPVVPSILGVPRTETPSVGATRVTVLDAGGSERTGQLVEVHGDLETVTVRTYPLPEPGDDIVFYLDSGMRFVALCESADRDLCVLRLTGSPRRRASLAETSGVRALRADNTRRRTDMPSRLTREDGLAHPCCVLDISLTGLFVATDALLRVGEVVQVGRAVARIVRSGPNGYGLSIEGSAPRAA